MKILVGILLIFSILLAGCATPPRINDSTTTVTTTTVNLDFNLPADLYSCYADEDCVLVSGSIEKNDCCQWSVVNEKHKGWYRDKVGENLRGCERVQCSIGPRTEAVCIKQRCEIKIY